MIRNGIDSEALGVEQKVSLLTLGLAQIPGVVALQLSIAGSDLPILVTDQDFSARLSAERLDPIETLRTPVDDIEAIRRDGRYGELLPRQVEDDRRLAGDAGAAAQGRARGQAGDLLGCRSISRRWARWWRRIPSPGAAR